VSVSRTHRITPRNFAELPSVLDSDEVSDVLRINVNRVRELTRGGRLRRLSYSANYLYDAREVMRFLEEETADG